MARLYHSFNRLLNDLDTLLTEEHFALEQKQFSYLEHISQKKAVILTGLSKELPTSHPYYSEKLRCLLKRDTENRALMQQALIEHKSILQALDEQAAELRRQHQALDVYSQQ